MNSQKRKTQWARLIRDNNSVLILALLLLACFIFVDGYMGSFNKVLENASKYGAVCVGLGLVMITGNIDLSVGFMAGVCGISSVLAFNAIHAATGNPVLSLILCILAALLVGAVLGALNGFVVAKIGVSPLIATIATNYIFNGLAFYFAKTPIAPADKEIVRVFVKTQVFGIKWLTPAVILFFAIIVLVALWMYKTRFGNAIYIVGDNPEAAAFSGISVSNTVFLTYVICGVFAALCGFLMVSYEGQAIYQQGNALATFPISCCVIGGIKMAGGKGTAVHILLGVIIMRAIDQMMKVLFLSPEMVNFITGVLLIVVLMIDRFTSSEEAI